MQQHLKLLQAVSRAGDDPRKAYLMRSRLRRALIALDRGLYRDVAPTPIAAELRKRARLLEQRALHLCQPSEALDLRWKREWASVRAELAELEADLADASRPTDAAA